MAVWDVNQSAQYDVVERQNDYDIKEGLFALPVAEEPPTDPGELAEWSPVQCVRAHAPYRIRKVTFIHQKTGNPPSVPSPISAGAFNFLGGMVAFDTPRPNLSMCSFDWRVGGEYLFVEDCVSRPGDGFVLGNNPFPTTMDVDNNKHYAPAELDIGAVAYAGENARRGYTQSQEIRMETNWLYNNTSYFPGDLLNEEAVNGEVDVTGVTDPIPIQTNSETIFNSPNQTLLGFNFYSGSSTGNFGGGGDFDSNSGDFENGDFGGGGDF